MAIKLLDRGISDFIILEKSNGFGGTWKDNVYPGCCCDGKRWVDLDLDWKEIWTLTKSALALLYSLVLSLLLFI